MKLEILYEDSNLIAFNKPSGLLTIPDRFDAEKPCLLRYAERQVGYKLFTVHRLDRDTSGIICFAKNENTHRHLSLQFEHRLVEKYYRTIVHGTTSALEGRIETAIAENMSKRGSMMVVKKGKPALTTYFVEQSWGHFSLMKVRIHTGRTHQIRVHLQFIGTPVICDTLYGSESEIFLSTIKKGYKLSKDSIEERPIISRLALHACELVFQDEMEQTIKIEAPLPKDMSAFIKQLDKNSK